MTYRLLPEDISDMTTDEIKVLYAHMHDLEIYIKQDPNAFNENQKLIVPNLLKFLEKKLLIDKKKLIKSHIEKLKTNPELQIADGFIYQFYTPNDNKKVCTKIGYSSNPERRIREWNGIKRGIYQVSHQRIFERIIHLYLSNYNLLRQSVTKDKTYREFFLFPAVLVDKIMGHLINKYINKDLRYNLTFQSLNPEPISSLNNWFIDVKYLINNGLNKRVEFLRQIEEEKEIREERRVRERTINKHPGKQNINTCSKSYLMSITQIGDVLSNRIINNRPYSSLDEVLGLYMIGPKRYGYISRKCYCD